VAAGAGLSGVETAGGAVSAAGFAEMIKRAGAEADHDQRRFNGAAGELPGRNQMDGQWRAAGTERPAQRRHGGAGARSARD
jgi:hypothetical protein